MGRLSPEDRAEDLWAGDIPPSTRAIAAAIRDALAARDAEWRDAVRGAERCGGPVACYPNRCADCIRIRALMEAK